MKFTKMHGLGNDYIYIDLINTNYNVDYSKFSEVFSNRNFGIGSDGVILISNSKIADFKMTMYNADGSKGKMCGNGIRCVGKYLYDNNYTSKTSLKIETDSGIKDLTLFLKDNMVDSIEVDMGKAIFTPELIPVLSDSNPVFDLKLDVLDKSFLCNVVSIGNPHAVIFTENLDNLDTQKYGSAIENDKHFPDRTNVEFVKLIDKNTINMAVWERGSGKTLACGSGACACAITAYLKGYINNEVCVNLLGGTLHIRIDENTKHIYMKGSAKKVFDGYIDDNYLKEVMYDKD